MLTIMIYIYNEKGVCEKCYKIYTIILEFMRNNDECTVDFKVLIKAKQFLIRGENLRVNKLEIFEGEFLKNKIEKEKNVIIIINYYFKENI